MCIRDSINTVVIAAPSKDYTDDEIKKIREWMNNGGNLGRNLAVFVNYQADCPNLYEYLNVDFGIEVTNNIIIETDVNRQYAYNQYYLYGDIADTDYTGNSAGDKKALTMVTRQLLTHRESDTSSTLFNTEMCIRDSLRRFHNQLGHRIPLRLSIADIAALDQHQHLI